MPATLVGELITRRAKMLTDELIAMIFVACDTLEKRGASVTQKMLGEPTLPARELRNQFQRIDASSEILQRLRDRIDFPEEHRWVVNRIVDCTIR